VTELRLERGDITRQAVDAVVNAANSGLLGGGGVDGAIHRAGGPAIVEACRAIVDRQGRLAPGRAVITTAGDLPARHVIHTVGPVWTAERAEEHEATLASCYRASLDLVAEHRLASVAFPAIATGAYGFPEARAATVAVAAVDAWLGANGAGVGGHAVGLVVFVCFDDEDHRHYERVLSARGGPDRRPSG
jgi:O-acetyl-ADP-ribose deacetylase (regulator of RNase III)